MTTFVIVLVASISVIVWCALAMSAGLREEEDETLCALCQKVPAEGICEDCHQKLNDYLDRADGLQDL